MNQCIMINTLNLRSKIKIYNNNINTIFQDYKTPEDYEYCACLSVVLLHSLIKIDNECSPQIFLE